MRDRLHVCMHGSTEIREQPFLLREMEVPLVIMHEPRKAS